MKLPEIKLLMLTFRLQAQASVVLPPFLGSTLRGAFGTALKNVFCFVPHQICQVEEKDKSNKIVIKERCWFFEACPYQYIFESPNLIPKAETHQLLKGHKNVSQPFILVPPIPKLKKNRKMQNQRFLNFNEDYQENLFSSGETVEFSIILIGKATSFWAQVLVAVRLAAQIGLGVDFERQSQAFRIKYARKAQAGFDIPRVPFILTEAFAHDSFGQPTRIFNVDNPKVPSYATAAVSLSRIVELRTKSLENEISEKNNNALQIEFLMPTRIRIADKIDASITLTDLLKKITERLEFLALLHADPPQEIDYREFLKGAENSVTEKKALRLYKYRQYSSRQERETIREVVLGKVVFGGNGLKQFLPFLIAGELLHVGSNTSAGFGNFIVQVSDD